MDCSSSSCSGHGSLRAGLGAQSRLAGPVERLYDVMVGVKASPRRRWNIGEAAADGVKTGSARKGRSDANNSKFAVEAAELAVELVWTFGGETSTSSSRQGSSDG